MKLVEIVIRPLGPFGTPLKGDTLFGHFFWQLVYDPGLIKGDLEHWRGVYGHDPFVVISSAFPRLKEKNRVSWFLPRPALPLHFFGKNGGNCFERLKHRKEKKARSFMRISGMEVDLRQVEFLNAREAAQHLQGGEVFLLQDPPAPEIYRSQPHNIINRLTFSTGEGFAPYQLDNLWFLPDLRLSVFVLYREEAFDEERLAEAFRRIGEMGFGRDASSGLGRFTVEELRPLPLPRPSKTLYTLGPYVPREHEYQKIWYQPFVRFGRHGGPLAISSNPFKEPVLMAGEGAVLQTPDKAGPFVGRAVTGLSKAEKDTLHQGYSLVFPLEGLP